MLCLRSPPLSPSLHHSLWIHSHRHDNNQNRTQTPRPVRNVIVAACRKWVSAVWSLPGLARYAAFDQIIIARVFVCRTGHRLHLEDQMRLLKSSCLLLRMKLSGAYTPRTRERKKNPRKVSTTALCALCVSFSLCQHTDVMIVACGYCCWHYVLLTSCRFTRSVQLLDPQLAQHLKSNQARAQTRTLSQDQVIRHFLSASE